MEYQIDLTPYHLLLEEVNTIQVNGRVTKLIGLVIEGQIPGASVGELCEIYPLEAKNPIKAEVVGFRNDKVFLMPLGEPKGLGLGSRILAKREKSSVKVGDALLGRVINGMGEPIDGKGEILAAEKYPIYNSPTDPFTRKRIVVPLNVGVRAINGLLTVGLGQKIGIFAGTGVGKSTLLGMIARYAGADVNVIALIGERNREVREFIEKDLGREGLKKSVVVVATSDQSPLVRRRGAYIATSIAEFFRDQKKKVLLMMDSVTRFAMAQREIGLSIGEPPTTKGYPPSVFALLPKLLERTGTSRNEGSISGFYTVLVEGDDLTEPISDCVRAILDGHIVLSRELSERNHYPAIDILNSISRVMFDIVDKKHLQQSKRLLEILATYKKAEDLINIGAYAKGSNPKIDQAIGMIEPINRYLTQDIEKNVKLEESRKQLEALLVGVGQKN